jgi:hypothetical protein
LEGQGIRAMNPSMGFPMEQKKPVGLSATYHFRFTGMEQRDICLSSVNFVRCKAAGGLKALFTSSPVYF